MLVIQQRKLPNPSLPHTLYQTRVQTSTHPPKTSNTTKTSRRSLLNKTLILSSPFILSTSSPAFSITNEEQNQSKPCQDLTITQKVYMDVSIDGEPAGRMVIGLFGNDVPRGARRFADLAMGTRGVGYRRKEFVKVTPSYIQHAGVRSFGVDSEMSKGGPMAGSDLLEELRYVSPKCSAGTFRGAVSLVLTDPSKPPDETKLVARDGKLVMRSQESRPDPNGTEFVISTKDDVSELRSIALLIGRVIDGLDVLDRISSVPSVQDNTSSPYFRAAKLIGDKRALVSERGFNRPFSKIVVTKCGEI